MPLAHLHRFHERTLDIDSDNGEIVESEDEGDIFFQPDESREETEMNRL